ncbi:MAG: flagellar hook-length control protein FliK [Burkholderiales bacterium]
MFIEMSIDIDALRTALTLLLRSAPAPRIELDPGAPRLPARSMGQTFQARVVAELPNGRSLIDVDGVQFDVRLPVTARVGERLQLQVLALEPRITFALVNAAPGAVRDPVAMSDSMRHLAALLERLSAESAAPQARGAAPVLASAPHDTAALAEGLKNTLTRRGLFYEAHQAQWIAGERPLSDLMLEPQAKLERTADAVHPQATGLVRQQLDILDTRQVVWNGQVWPDQSLEWRIEEEAHRDREAGDSTPTWRTSLRLTLPRLGDVTAALSIRGDRVSLAFSDLAADAHSAVTAGQPALQDAFAKAGLTLMSVVIPDSRGRELPGIRREPDSTLDRDET